MTDAKPTLADLDAVARKLGAQLSGIPGAYMAQWVSNYYRHVVQAESLDELYRKLCDAVVK